MFSSLKIRNGATIGADEDGLEWISTLVGSIVGVVFGALSGLGLVWLLYIFVVWAFS
jgi:hypothetical protein